MNIETLAIPLLITVITSIFAYKNTTFGYCDFSAVIWFPAIIIDLIAWLVWALL